MGNASVDQRKKLVLRFELRKLMLRLQLVQQILVWDVNDLHCFLDLFSVCVGIDLYLKIVVSLILKDKHGMLHLFWWLLKHFINTDNGIVLWNLKLWRIMVGIWLLIQELYFWFVHFDLLKDFLVKKLILGYLSLLVPLSLWVILVLLIAWEALLQVKILPLQESLQLLDFAFL